MGNVRTFTFDAEEGYGLKDTRSFKVWNLGQQTYKSFPIAHLNTSQIIQLVTGDQAQRDEISPWSMEPDHPVQSVPVYYLQFRNDFLSGLGIARMDQREIQRLSKDVAWTMVFPVVIDWDAEIDNSGITPVLKAQEPETITIEIAKDDLACLGGKTYKLVEA